MFTFSNHVYLSQNKEWSIVHLSVQTGIFLQYINPLPAMELCKMANLKYISWDTCWEILFVGLLFLQNVPIGLYTLFTALPQEQTFLVDTQVWMKNFCMQSKQGPDFRLQWMTCRYGWNTLIIQPVYRPGA